MKIEVAIPAFEITPLGAENVELRKALTDITRILGHGCNGLSNDEVVEKVRAMKIQLDALTKFGA